MGARVGGGELPVLGACTGGRGGVGGRGVARPGTGVGAEAKGASVGIGTAAGKGAAAPAALRERGSCLDEAAVCRQ